MGPWIPLTEGTLEPNAMYLFGSPEGTYLFAAGCQKEIVMKEYPILTSYRLFCEPPIS